MHIAARQITAGLVLAFFALFVVRKAIPGFFWRTAMGYQNHHDHEMAEKYLLRALKIERVMQRITGSTLGVAHVSGSLGFLYHRQLRFDEAIDMFNRALADFTASGHTGETAPILASLGKLYFDAGDLVRAEDNLRKALALYEHRPDAGEARQILHDLLNAISSRLC
jgi:tetratricopeptide (TPR) repeat protein